MTGSAAAADPGDSGAATSVHLTDRNGGVLSQDGTTYTSPSGEVEHGVTTPDGLFLPDGVVRVVGGQKMYGTPTDGGGFLSADGTTYVDSSGKIEHGLTAPDGYFLPNGAVRVIDGVRTYGSVTDDGGFLSEDGKTFVTPTGVVEHGKTADDGRFLTQRVVDGRPLWGSDTVGDASGTGWISEDGTVYIDPVGKVVHGLTAPDGKFLANGSVREIDGVRTYGSVTEGGGFLSEDGKTFVTPTGVVEHGKTADDGRFLTQRVVDGRPLWGSDTVGDASGTGWISEDGTVYIDPVGKVVHGLTAPDGKFLANGSVREIDGVRTYGSVTDDGGFLSEDGKTFVTPTGVVEHGKTADDGRFLTQRVVDGRPLWGSDTVGDASGTGWISEDGTVYIDPVGKVVHGLTAPDGKFLANGSVREIDGVRTYGSVTEGGGFLSEDGTTYVTPGGVVEHGKTTDDGRFLTPRVIDGATYLGGDTDDKGWISEDGTIYIDPSGTVEHGISTPDGQFLPGGTTRTLANGTVLYGFPDGSDFYSADGKTLVLADGTVVNGTLDVPTGVFTSSGGAVYVLTDSGIQSGTPQSDGSITLADGQTFMTPASWTNDLRDLADSISYVQGKAGTISDQIDTITSQYSLIEELWATPAGQSFTDVAAKANAAMAALQTLLGDTTDRMQTTHDNYQRAEEAAVKNSTAGQ